jgi:56kDa selenium binding protein (SBP56)
MPEGIDPTFYRSPAAAIAAPPEKLAYVVAFDPAGTQRDAMTVIDCDAEAPSYRQVVGWAELRTAGNEFRHFGWNACSSALCHEGHAHHGLERRYLLAPGVRSPRTYVSGPATACAATTTASNNSEPASKPPKRYSRAPRRVGRRSQVARGEVLGLVHPDLAWVSMLQLSRPRTTGLGHVGHPQVAERHAERLRGWALVAFTLLVIIAAGIRAAKK